MYHRVSNFITSPLRAYFFDQSQPDTPISDSYMLISQGGTPTSRQSLSQTMSQVASSTFLESHSDTSPSLVFTTVISITYVTVTSEPDIFQVLPSTQPTGTLLSYVTMTQPQRSHHPETVVIPTSLSPSSSLVDDSVLRIPQRLSTVAPVVTSTVISFVTVQPTETRTPSAGIVSATATPSVPSPIHHELDERSVITSYIEETRVVTITVAPATQERQLRETVTVTRSPVTTTVVVTETVTSKRFRKSL